MWRSEEEDLWVDTSEVEVGSMVRDSWIGGGLKEE